MARTPKKSDTPVIEPDTPEWHVNRYLSWVADPGSVVDHDKVAELEVELENAPTATARLLVLNALHHAKALDGSDLEQGFIDHARLWGMEHGLSPAVWRAAGANDDILLRAGIIEQTHRIIREERPQGRQRAARVETDVLAAHIDNMAPGTVYRLAEIRDAVGGSDMTIRKTNDAAIAEGKVERLGSDPAWENRGRAPILYRRTDS
jgi:hypothetical protein